MKKFIFGFLLIFLLIPAKVFALNEVNIYFFYGDSCNLCSQEETYLEALKERYFNIRVYSYNISSDTNLNLMNQAKDLYNVTKSGIPFTVIGDTPFLGFSQSIKCDMEDKIYEYSYNKYSNKFGSNVVNVSYRTDLVGDVQKNYDTSDYMIEETGEITTTITENKKTSIWDNEKYKYSLILIFIGIDLSLVLLIIWLIERKRRI